MLAYLHIIDIFSVSKLGLKATWQVCTPRRIWSGCGSLPESMRSGSVRFFIIWNIISNVSFPVHENDPMWFMQDSQAGERIGLGLMADLSHSQNSRRERGPTIRIPTARLPRVFWSKVRRRGSLKAVLTDQNTDIFVQHLHKSVKTDI